MSNKNFGEPWEGKIERIRENLREGRYALQDGIFPIVKELIQNAEDARSKRLLVAWDPGLLDAEHPLLRGPALLAINDGDFDRSNGRAIREMGLSSKASDSSTIGKFGLGMKSVFHLGEAFFFVAIDESGRKFIDADIRSPWSTDNGGLHADWDEFAKPDQIAIAKRVQLLFSKGKSFCLWVPLRTSTNCGGVDPIESYYPGDEVSSKLLGPKQFESAAAIIPLLAHLKSIQFRISEPGHLIDHDINVTVSSSRRAPLAISENTNETLAKFEGQVESKAAQSTTLLTYSGAEHRLKDAQLCLLEKDETKKWPKRFATNKTTGRSEQVPEKASQHSAICFVAARHPHGRTQLRIHWAVFLPLGQPETLDIDSVGWDVDLVLHGWFFPNSGRTEIEGLRQETPSFDAIHDSATVRLAWNHRLARCGTLPLLPMVCADIARRCEWNDTTRIAITRAIQQSEVFSRFREDVCQRDAFVRRMTNSGKFEWQVVPANRSVFSLPDTHDELLPSTVFPALRSVADEQVVVLLSSPRLTTFSAEHCWPTEVVSKLLTTVSAADLMSSRSRCEYFIRFLDKAIAEHSSSIFSDELVALTRSALIAVRGKFTTESCATLRLLLSRIPSESRIRLSLEITDDSTADLFLELCNSTNAIVWIPDALFRAEFNCNGHLTAPEAVAVLKALTRWSMRKLTAQQADRLGVVAAQVFRATRELASLVGDTSDMKLFSGTNCRERREIPMSWSDIIDHHRRRVLFSKPSPMAYQLQEALVSDSIVLVTKELADVFFNHREDAPSQCREGQMLAALSVAEKPVLAGPNQRKKLFETMLKFAEGRRASHFRESVRYLMHGRTDRFSATEPLLVQADSGNDVWWRIAQISLTSLDQRWRIVDPVFSVMMSAEDRREFDVEVIDPDVAVQLAVPVTSDVFCALRPSEAEYAILLKHIVDDDLLKRLPIHQDLEHNFVSITDRSFWQGKWLLPVELQQTACVLKRAHDDFTWKRQQQLVPPLDALAVIGIALARDNPERYWSLIMDCLVEANPLPEATIVRLKTTPWAPQSNGMAAKPEDVLYLSRLNDDVARLVTEYPGVFVDSNALSPALRNHAAFETFLGTIVPGNTDALVMLGTLLLEDDSNAVGKAEVSFEDWLGAFQFDDGTIFPQIGLLRAVSEKLPNAAESTFEVLQIPISDSRMRQLLACLHGAHVKERSNSRRKTIVRVFGRYLRQLIAVTDYRGGILGTNLPTLETDWKSPHELCLANDGVSPSYVVDQQIEEELSTSLPTALWTEKPHLNDEAHAGSCLKAREPDWNVSAAAKRLREYFVIWRDLVPNEQVGGFLALLGDDADIRELAQEFLGRNRTLEETRDKFGLPAVQCGRDPAGLPIMEDAHTMIRKQRVVVEIADEPTVRVLNLFGDEITAPRNDRPATLFVGYGNRNNPFPHRMDQGLRLRCFRLNAIDPTSFSELELSRLLRDSAAKFICEAYNSWENQTRFAAAWDELAASDQLDICIAQSLILDSAFEKLISYGLRGDQTLCPLLDDWRGAKKRQVEHELGGSAVRNDSSAQVSKTLQSVSARLVQLLELDSTVQNAILCAVRSQVHNRYQYQHSSIPFELFQNADDAYGELHDYFVESKPLKETSMFAVRAQCGVLSFVHMGRRINQYPVGRDIGTLGFDDDLWKMGCLHLSDKDNVDHRASVRTGKFGIGFKSVFLACDRPRLLSGRMAFEFLAGIYPRTLPADQRQSLYALRDQEARNDPQATIIELSLREGVSVEQVMHRFESLVHIQVVFARNIRSCILDGGTNDVTWQPTKVSSIEGCHAGEVRPAKSIGPTADTHRVIHFTSDAGALLFAVGSRGFESFEAHIPTVWVTAPTEEELQLGFLINGRFAIDVGRAQLARDPAHNREAAHRLGGRFGQQLAEFFVAFSAPSTRMEIRSALRFAADVKSFDIWNSLWERLVVAVSERANSDQPADQLIRDALWQSSDSGVASFYSKFEAIPVRLPGKLFESELVKLPDVRFALRGVLAQRDRRPEFDGYALACIRNWPAFRERIGSGKIVSYDRVVRPLERLCQSLVQNIPSVSLAEVLSWEWPHPMIDPEKAERFGELLTRDFIAQITDQVETNRIRDILNTAEFLAADGQYHTARELLISRSPFAEAGWSSDECLRTGFASPSRVLSKQYGENGLRFFVACREKLTATPQELARWIREARDNTTRKAGLIYLVEGETGRSVQSELRIQDLAGTWLDDLANAPAFHELSQLQQHRLADLLSRNDAATLLDTLLRGVPRVPQLNPRKVLRAVHDWWIADGHNHIGEYEDRVYPNGGLRFLADQLDEHAQQRRKDWVTLFLIGLTHTMGRTVAEQHRGFLRQCEREGWLDMIASSERQPGPWMKWIESFLDQQLDDSRFLQWMKQFVGIYQVSRHLDDYIELFLAVQRFQGPFTLTQLTNTRASSDFQAGGISAPPLSHVLGMGQCFVLRELQRHGILTNPYARPHCFVPVARVRRMLIDLGCEALATSQKSWEWSRDIFAFLQQHLGADAATFDGAFDIPLQIVADDVGLQMQFFDTPIESEDEESALWFEDDDSAESEDK